MASSHALRVIKETFKPREETVTNKKKMTDKTKSPIVTGSYITRIRQAAYNLLKIINDMAENSIPPKDGDYGMIASTVSQAQQFLEEAERLLEYPGYPGWGTKK